VAAHLQTPAVNHVAVPKSLQFKDMYKRRIDQAARGMDPYVLVNSLLEAAGLHTTPPKPLSGRLVDALAVLQMPVLAVRCQLRCRLSHASV